MKWGATGRFPRANPKRAWLARQQVGGIECPRNHIERSDGPKRVAHWALNGTRHQEERLGKQADSQLPKNSAVRPTNWEHARPTRQPRQPQSPTFKGLQPTPPDGRTPEQQQHQP